MLGNDCVGLKANCWSLNTTRITSSIKVYTVHCLYYRNYAMKLSTKLRSKYSVPGLMLRRDDNKYKD